MIDFEDDPEEVEPKFDDCGSCKFFGKLKTCNNCDIGEFFEELDPEGVDSFFRENSSL